LFVRQTRCAPHFTRANRCDIPSTPLAAPSLAIRATRQCCDQFRPTGAAFQVDRFERLLRLGLDVAEPRAR
jgi:hypothetical protein